MSKEHWNGGSGGKGSKPRPFAVPLDDYGNSHTRIFGEKKKFCSGCGKSFSWCQCPKTTDDYQDILSTEDCVLSAFENKDETD